MAGITQINQSAAQFDGSGNLKVTVAGGVSVGAVNITADAHTSAQSFTDGTSNPLQADTTGALRVTGSISASTSADYHSAVQTFTNNSTNPLQADVHGALLTSIRDSSGAVQGALANPVRVDPTGTTTQPISGTVAVSGTVPVSGTFWQATQPVSGTVAVSGTVPVSGTFWQATQPVSGTVTANAGTGTFAISAASLPLPSGAATSARQPALGTAGSAATDVITVQGIASMTALKVDGSAVTQPVSGSVTATISGTPSVAQSGTWTVQPGNTANTTAWLTTSNPTTTGGLTAAKVISAATTNATSVKASAGQVYNVQLFNTATSVRYAKLYNKASAPTVGTDTPVAVWMIPASSSGVVIEISNGITCSSGIAIAITGAVADSDTTAIGANEVVLNIQYK